jgi:carbon-monoxide dehydrogenase large subunit
MSLDTEPVTLPSGVAARFVGQRMPRTEDQRMITGHGRYIDDLDKPGMVHVAFVRSQVAAGRITGLDVTEARQAPGVIAVLTAAEVNPLVTIAATDADKTPRGVLAAEYVRFVGDPIAMVLAESRYLAEDAAELVSVDIEPGQAVVTAEQALAEGAPLVHPELANNAAGVLPTADSAELDAIFENAPHVFTETFAQHRYVNVPMETRGLVAEWDVGAKQLEVVIACQGVHDVRAFYAAMLGMPADDIRVTMGDVGGSFGQKAFPTRDEQAVVAAAIILGDRPVKWIEDRAENLISAGHARQESLRISAAVDDKGVFLGAKANHTENVGAFPTGSNGQMAGLSSLVFPGPYHWSGPGSVAYSGQAAYTNTCGQCAYRGPWMMETTGREQMVDVIAHRLGIDPLEIRRRNVLSRTELPYTNPMTLVYDGVSPQECLEQAAKLIGYDQFRKEQKRARAKGRLLGLGLSLYIEPQPSGGQGGSAAATIRIEPSGKINVYMGTGSHGQGIETTMTQIVADEMGVKVEDVHYIQGDTDSTPYGFLTGGSLTAGVVGGAAHLAGVAMKERVLAVAGQMMEIDPGDLEMSDQGRP